jgi:hypothetical protein
LIHRLRPMDRQVMLLYLEDMDAESIGEITGISAGNVRVQIHQARHSCPPFSRRKAHMIHCLQSTIPGTSGRTRNRETTSMSNEEIVARSENSDQRDATSC